MRAESSKLHTGLCPTLGMYHNTYMCVYFFSCGCPSIFLSLCISIPLSLSLTLTLSSSLSHSFFVSLSIYLSLSLSLPISLSFSLSLSLCISIPLSLSLSLSYSLRTNDFFLFLVVCMFHYELHPPRIIFMRFLVLISLYQYSLLQHGIS